VYGTLAAVYDFLVPEALLSPEGSAAAFDGVLGGLEPGARVLDCACGTGTLAVGLALRGLEVTASDASPEMVARTQALAAERGVPLETATRAWAELDGDRFDAVLCVGNSLTHAGGRAGRLTALDGMRRVSREGALLAITSRNWEREQESGDEIAERGGRRAAVRRLWHGGDPPQLQIFVTLEDGSTYSERLSYWPFTHEELDADLRAVGFEPEASTWTPDADRYLVTSRAKASNASR
jgi:cyclopropane fatty-acyl-phospholipid synthase-like methyltransferase